LLQQKVGRGFTTGALTVLCTALSWAFLAAGALAVGPVNTLAPAIPGTAKEGVALTVTQGTWTPTPTAVTDQWMSCKPFPTCTAVGPANSPTYTPGPTDVGATIEVVESAGDGTPPNTSTAQSNQTSPVAPLSPPVNSPAGPPTITGVYVQGQTLTASPGTWSDSAQATYTYQWSSCLGATCSNVGTQSPQYVLAPTDAGHTIKVQVTATNDGGPGVPASSAATPTVIGPPTNTTPPKITGNLQQGQTLTETPGVWTYSPNVVIQWERCDAAGDVASCTPIPGATNPTYTLNGFDVGNTIRVQETASNAVGLSAGGPASSAVTAVVIPQPPSGNPVPQILGSVAQGQTLTEAHGAWSNNPTSFSYQWQQCDAAGNNCTAIHGETNSTYTVSRSDVGHALRVEEFATNAGGTSGPASSAATSPVDVQSSFTSLSVVPTAAVTNQAVTLIATVVSTSSSTADRPSGTITFEDRGHPIGGCANETVAPTDQSVSVTCQASFAASTSPEQLTAVFKPSSGSNVGASTGPSGKPYSLTVGRDSTSSDLQVSNSTVNAGGSVTYTATVTPGRNGPTSPSGSVVFLDGGTPIGACIRQPLTKSGGFVTATCKVTYRANGKHSITARYDGDTSFSGSSSSLQLVNVHTPRGHCCVTAGMHWTFFYSPSYTKVLAFIVNNVPGGTNVIVGCHGRGCPFTVTTIAVKATVCKPKRKCTPRHPVTMQLAGRFHRRHLALGTRITVQIVRAGWVGKYYGFIVQPGRGPSVKKACLALGSSRPGVGC
jgi:hypothetical protein